MFQIANIPLEESESDDESSEEEEEIETDDPMWVLYNAVRYYKSPGGNELAEPFITLPSKRELPDYYITIPEPISLNMVKTSFMLFLIALAIVFMWKFK